MRQLNRIALISLLCAACAPVTAPLEAQRMSVLLDGLQQRLNRDEARIGELSERLLLLQHTQAPVAVVAAPVPPKPVSYAPPPQPVFVPESPPVVLSLTPRRSTLSEAGDAEERRTTPSAYGARSSELFNRALIAYQDGKAARAFEDFDAFIRTYPHHPDADSARYWMGQCKFDAEQYLDAIEQYTALANAYPQSSKAAEALFKTGVAFERLQKLDRAHAVFARLIAAYPNTASAELARSREHASEESHAP